MKIQKAVLSLALIFMCGVVFAAKKPILNIQHWKTSNGAKVFFVRASELPMLDVRVAFAAGSAYDDNKFGLANMVNSMIGESSKAMDANQVATSFDSVGAQMDTDTGRDMAMVALRTLTQPQYLNKALETFIDVLVQPDFHNARVLQRVKNSIVAGIKVGEQTPTTIARNAFYKAVYVGTPYAHPVLGNVQQINATSAKQLQSFYSRYYVANNADVILVGDITKGQAEKIAEQVVGRLPKGKPAAALDMVKPSGKPEIIHINYPSKSTTTIIGQVGITRNNKNYIPLIVGNSILGGSGLTSLLYQKVRVQRGLVYFIGSSFTPLQYRGPFSVILQTKAAKAANALGVVKNAMINYVKNGPTEKQLNVAKQNIIGKFPLGLASNKSIVSVLTAIAFYHRPLNYLDQFTGKVSKVTTSGIRNAFQKTLHPNNMVVVTVGPKV